MKNKFSVSVYFIVCSITFSVLGCGGGSSNPSTTGAAQCAQGYTMVGANCVANSGVGTTTAQGCTAGYVWNGSVCVPQNTTTTAATPIQNAQSQYCATGEYYNGAACSIIVTNGNCQSGQIYTQRYGCAHESTRCESMYEYTSTYGNSCLPNGIISNQQSSQQSSNSPCYSNCDDGYSSGGCSNGSNSNASTCRKIKKVKLNRDGSIRRIRYYRR